MTLRALVVTTVAVAAGLAAACESRTRTPIGNGGSLTGPTQAALASLKITGPDSIAPGQTVSFVATGTMSDLTTQDYTRKVVWSAGPASVLTIARDTGEATGQTIGDASINAAFQGGGRCCQASTTRTVLPPNTYRLTGKVLEFGLPVQGAAMTVLSGVGVGLSATTDSIGAYRLYGVGGGIQVKFSKAGYEEIVKTFTATQNDVLDFPDARQTAAIPSIGGAYTMTVTADPACPTTAASNRIAALPDDFRQPRSYAVSLTQDGPSLTVTLTDSAIRLQQNHFTGRVEPDSIEFQLGDGYYGYGLDDGVAEQLSPTQAYVFGGQLHAQRSGSAIVGRLNGPLEIYTQQATFYTLTGQCLAPNSPVTLTRGAQPARYR